MTTLKEVAAEARVHIATASAVLNAAGGNTRVSPATRARVLAAAKKLSYTRNESARRLRTGDSNAIGFLGGDLRNPFFAELAAALEMELARQHFQLFISHVAHLEADGLQATINGLRQQGVRKIICWEESFSRSTLDPSNDFRLSIGFTNRPRAGVWLDLEHAIAVAIEAWVQRGFKRLGFFAPRLQQESPSVRARCRAFAKECHKRQLPAPTLAFYEGESWNLDAASLGARKVLKKGEEVEAWMGFNDVAALGLLSQWSRKNTSRVFCFDGTALSRHWPGNPPHLDLRIGDMAQKAALTISGKLDASTLGSRSGWLRPLLVA